MYGTMKPLHTHYIAGTVCHVFVVFLHAHIGPVNMCVLTCVRCVCTSEVANSVHTSVLHRSGSGKIPREHREPRLRNSRGNCGSGNASTGCPVGAALHNLGT